ncbi:unnamed protein product [Orchesella dallaii]|uniref:SCP domain-containing protein n=1 Tax=Orchesella dallaii TaxID=48710 RepID=A0ABP1RII8_9HEXA
MAIISYIQWKSAVIDVIDYQRLFLQLINGYRARHHSPPLFPSAELNHEAVKCAQFYAIKGNITRSCPYKPTNSTETIYSHNGNKSSFGVPYEDVLRDTLNDWYSQESVFDYDSSVQLSPTGNFAKMVWRSSKNVGFGIGKHGHMVVGYALYNPVAVFNDTVELKKNVLRP